MADSQWQFLREELELLPAPSNRLGAPTWTLHDPIAGKFFRLGWVEFEILKRWNLSDVKKIIHDVNTNTLLKIVDQDILELYQFLKTSSLLQSQTSDDTQILTAIKNSKSQGSWLNRLLKNYLFFRIPLIYPDQFLNILKPYVQPLFNILFLKIILVLLVIGAFLVFRNFDEFLNGFQILQTPAGLIMGFFTLAFAKIIHEMGHAITCKYYGCRVPAMGIAFIVMWPLLWTDTTDAWRLKNKNQRLLINGAGMIAELSLAAIASILWTVSPEGLFKDAMHILAGVTWIMTLFVNLNPFMRFDGYYLMSDALDIPNLQDRSFKMAKGVMRQSLWGIVDDIRDTIPKSLILYAYATWIYRFFLFLGIALLVYHFFFKALGVFLMIVELWWFIVKPIINELEHWLKNRDKMTVNFLKKYNLILLCVMICAVIFIPWQSKINAPAILKNAQEIPILTSIEGQLIKIHVQSGDAIKKDDVLFTFQNPNIQHALQSTKINVENLEKDLKSKLVDPNYYREASLLKNQLQQSKSEYNLKKIESQKLIIKSPIDGIVVDIPNVIIDDNWMPKKNYLGLIKSNDQIIESYIDETNLSRIQNGALVKFYYDTNVIHGAIESIDTNITRELPHPELGSNFGGDIVMEANDNGKLKTRNSYYKIIIKMRNVPLNIQKTILGNAAITANHQSIFIQSWREILSIFIQESNF